MNLKSIVSLPGKPGIYRVISQLAAGFSLKRLDQEQAVLVVNNLAQLTVLSDVSIFGQAGDIPLTSVFEAFDKADEIPSVKADDGVLKAFFLKAVPLHDANKVYPSVIKKLITWHGMLSVLPLWQQAPEESTDTPLNRSQAAGKAVGKTTLAGKQSLRAGGAKQGAAKKTASRKAQ